MSVCRVFMVVRIASITLYQVHHMNQLKPARLLWMLLLCLLLAGARCSDLEVSVTTDVKSEEKISATSGNFNGNLNNGDRFGSAVTRVGDLEVDSVTDLAVGAPFFDGNGTDRGAIWMLFMDSDGRVDIDREISDSEGLFLGNLANEDRFGSALAGIGDLDGDGFLDIAVGAPGDDDGSNDAGAVWILFMNAIGTVRIHQKISSRAGGFLRELDDGDEFGSAVADIGDLDGDGIRDLAVGAMKDDDGSNDAGAVWILFMNQEGRVASSQKISDTRGGFQGDLDEGDNFGSSITSLGDLDEDGLNEIAVGATGDDDGGEDKGAVWILFMNEDGTVDSDRKISQNKGNFDGKLDDGDRFGSALASMGDLDEDGFTDLAVGADRDDDGGDDRGAVWILFLEDNGDVRSQSKISSTESNFDGNLRNGDEFGSAIADIGDLDGDGIRDLAVGARNDDDGGVDRGAVWILFMDRTETETETENEIIAGSPLIKFLLNASSLGDGLTGSTDSSVGSADSVIRQDQDQSPLPILP